MESASAVGHQACGPLVWAYTPATQHSQRARKARFRKADKNTLFMAGDVSMEVFNMRTKFYREI
jgi:hypothetical protein